jgi:membrane associated rhomboid family serine protease
VRIWVLAFGRIPIRLPAWIPLTLWVGFQFYMLVADFDGVVSWAAHIGGIVSGALLVVVLRRRGVPLFDRRIVTPKAVETTQTRLADGTPSPWGRRRTSDN